VANGEEDLIEKNKGRRKPLPEKRYNRWSSSLGEEDSGMLLEKSSGWRSTPGKKSKWESEDC